MATKPTKPDGLDVLLSWPQGRAAEARTTQDRKSGPARARSQPDRGASTSPDDLIDQLSERLDRFESEIRARIDEMVDKIEEIVAQQNGDTERVLKGLEGIRRRLPVASRTTAAKRSVSPEAASQDPPPATPSGRRLRT